MCPSMSNTNNNQTKPNVIISASPFVTMSGRQVLQPCSNGGTALRKTKPLKKISTPLLPPKPLPPSNQSSPTSTKHKPSGTPDCDMKKAKIKPIMIKSKSFSARVAPILNIVEYNNTISLTSSLILESPTCKHEERKSRIAHYGRVSKPNTTNIHTTTVPQATQSEKRCTFITPYSDPIFVAYHDEEWGVPVHDDRLLFELLVITGAQVGSDWTTVLKKRQAFKDAYAGFDAQLVAKFTEKQMVVASITCGMDLSKVRGVVDNANRILEVKGLFGSLDKYFWGFVNNKPMITNYKTSQKIPVKTSKSESISKDMMKRGFRSVGPTAIHSFTQAAGLTNDHLVSCQCHAKCAGMA